MMGPKRMSGLRHRLDLRGRANKPYCSCTETLNLEHVSAGQGNIVIRFVRERKGYKLWSGNFRKWAEVKAS